MRRQRRVELCDDGGGQLGHVQAVRVQQVGADGAVPGVFAWRPPPGLVAALSDLLDRGAAA